MKTVKLGNYEVEIDNTEVDFLKKYEKAAEYYANNIGNISEDGTASGMMAQVFSVFEKTFETMFGKGVCEKMFGKKKSVDECVIVYQTLIENVNDFSATVERMNGISK